ncbi:MAG TPA: hypothetical protein VFH85_04000 [Gammaproteobacteria bacterium]|nr:hypothetical protein [Gammaproteobacteria bacterium]
MTTAQYLILWLPFVGTILIVFGMKYFSALFQARARIADDARYRALAEKIAAVTAEHQVVLSAMQAELSNLAANVATVERILKQVE